MKNKLSCRDGVYGDWKSACDMLAGSGINNIELQIKDPEDLKKATSYAESKGIKPLTAAGGIDCDDPEKVDVMKQALSIMGEINIDKCFVSVKGEERAKSIETIKELADLAGENGVVLCMETHPPFCRNAQGMLDTMADVDHENVRVNFDTANIYYYNKDLADSLSELKKIMPYVASIHLKDTDGGYESFNFPVFGEGVVDFPGVFAILKKNGFDGPLTIELEGELIKGLDLDGKHSKVMACVDYLEKSGSL